MSGSLDIKALFNRTKDIAYAAQSAAYKALQGAQGAIKLANISLLPGVALFAGAHQFAHAATTATTVGIPILMESVIATAGTITVTNQVGVGITLTSSNGADVSVYGLLVFDVPAVV